MIARAREIADVLWATWQRFVRDRMADGAASLAYYLLLSLIPSLLIFGAVVKVLGADAAADIVEYAAEQGASPSLTGALDGVLDTAVESAPEGAGAAGLLGVATLVYGASRALTAAGRLLDVIAGRAVTGRPLVRRAKDIGWTVVLLVLVLVLLALVFVTGSVVRGIFGAIGQEDAGTIAWDVLRWPAAFLLGIVVVGLVAFAAPSDRVREFRPWTAGGLFTVAAFLGGSAAYGLYLANLSRYNATYGAFAALVILMLWVWGGSLAFLFGAELDAELRARERAAPPAVDESDAGHRRLARKPAGQGERRP